MKADEKKISISLSGIDKALQEHRFFRQADDEALAKIRELLDNQNSRLIFDMSELTEMPFDRAVKLYDMIPLSGATYDAQVGRIERINTNSDVREIADASVLGKRKMSEEEKKEVNEQRKEVIQFILNQLENN